MVPLSRALTPKCSWSVASTSDSFQVCQHVNIALSKTKDMKHPAIIDLVQWM